MRTKIIVIAAILIMIGGVSWGVLQQGDLSASGDDALVQEQIKGLSDREKALTDKEKALELQGRFVQQFGADKIIKAMVRPTDEFLFVWDDPKKEGEDQVTRHFTLYLDGLFSELGQVKVSPQESK